jgi:ABC-type lipoprotein export system ATPase subunit/multidrug efflux pump subunit AcrA (membrane-fusion protein)
MLALAPVVCPPSSRTPHRTEDRRALAVSCRHLAKDFIDGPARVPAVRDVSLEIPFGKLTLLAGPSGCGKTTLLSLLGGLLEPDTGHISVLGTDLSQLSGQAKVHFRSLQMGLVFQQYHLLPALTAVENVAVPLTVAGQSKSAALVQAAAALREVGMEEYLEALPRRLSGGQQQRVAIARALVHQPRLLLCDEPTSALDVQNGKAVMTLLRRLAMHRDRAVVVVTHDPRVFAFGDRIIHMNDGRVDRVEERVVAERVSTPSMPELRPAAETREAAQRGGSRRLLLRLVLPVASFGLLLLAGGQAVKAARERLAAVPPYAPAETPFRGQVAGLGIVEAGSENIAVGAPAPGLVRQVFVRVGQTVHADEPLFCMDTRTLEAELHVREANLALSEVQLQRLESLPRPEELPITAAKVREARAEVTEKEDALARGRRAGSAISTEVLVQLAQSSAAAAARLARAEAEENLLLAGAWSPEKESARAMVAAARAQIRQTQVELDRLCVRAPVDGKVLRVNVRPGEAASAAPGPGLVVLGNTELLHVRAEIDEHDIPRWRPEAAARAVPVGDAGQGWPLQFVRVEPLIVAKKSLSGDDGERVDARVLQIIYSLPKNLSQVPYVGQQVNVFLDSPETDGSGGSGQP